MKPFLTTRRKTIELGVLLVLGAGFYLLWPGPEGVVLFSFGYVWNWVGSQDLQGILENKRYRFSMLKLVVNLQKIFQRPVAGAPEAVKIPVRILPAGLFWLMVITFNESTMPWWSTFLGSLCFELVQFLPSLVKGKKVEVV